MSFERKLNEQDNFELHNWIELRLKRYDDGNIQCDARFKYYIATQVRRLWEPRASLFALAKRLSLLNVNFLF